MNPLSEKEGALGNASVTAAPVAGDVAIVSVRLVQSISLSKTEPT